MNNEIKNGVYTYNGEDIQFNFRTSLGAYDKVRFVNSVTKLLIGDNYNYVIRDLVFAFYIVDIFTDIDTSDIDDIGSMEKFINNTNVVDIVLANVVDGTIEQLNKCVDLNIEYRTGIHPNLISDSLSSLLDTIERKVDEIDLNSMMEFAKSMSGISGELTAEKMLDAYAKTDIFKKNWSNTENAKDSLNVVDGNTREQSPVSLA